MVPKYFLLSLIFGMTSIALANDSDVLLSTKNPAMKFFEIKNACLAMGHPHTLIASADGLSRIDCMGTKILATDFCRHQFLDNPRLLRGVISPDKKVACHFASSAILTVTCGRFPAFCKTADAGCRALAPYYAVNLELSHSGMSMRDDGKYLQCYFSEKNFELEGENP